MSGYKDVRSLEGGRFRAVVTHDDCPENPFGDADVRLVQFHRKYGTKHGFEDPAAVDRHCANTGAVAVPAYLTDHSSLHYSTQETSGWDSGRVGHVLFEKSYVQMIAKHIFANVTSQRVQDRLLEIATSMLSVYSDYANGWVYRVEIFEADEEHDPVDEANCLYGDDQVDEFISRFVASLQPTMPPPALSFMANVEAFV